MGDKEARQYKKDLAANKIPIPGENQNSCFMHRETYINRKIPLNALLSVQVDRVTNLKENIENIEHFTKMHQGFEDKSEAMSGTTYPREPTAQ